MKTQKTGCLPIRSFFILEILLSLNKKARHLAPAFVKELSVRIKPRRGEADC